MKKFLYIFLILTIGITGLVLSYESTQAANCTFLNCEATNIAGCKCGQAITIFNPMVPQLTRLFCCEGNNMVYATPEECKVNACDPHCPQSVFVRDLDNERMEGIVVAARPDIGGTIQKCMTNNMGECFIGNLTEGANYRIVIETIPENYECYYCEKSISACVGEIEFKLDNLTEVPEPIDMTIPDDGNGGNGGGNGNGYTGPTIVSGGSTEIQNPLDHDTFDALVKAIIGFVFKIALVIAPLMIIVAGFLFLTSAGDPKKIETAKAVLMYTLIGLGICLMATGIIKLINQVLGFGG